MPGREPNKEDAPYRPWGPGHPDWTPRPAPKPNAPTKLVRNTQTGTVRKVAVNMFDGSKKDINETNA